MALVERYLHAVEFWLPKAQQKDILAELSEDIHSEIDDQERASGRKLTDPEIEALLKQRGSPFRVASRYLPQRYLIGPAFFPLYTLVLKAILLFYLVPWLVSWVAMVAFMPSFRAAHPGLSMIWTLEGWWIGLVYSFGLATVIIALVERAARGKGFADSWERKWSAPVPREAYRIARGDSVGQFLGGIVFALWWLGIIHRPQIEGLALDFAAPVYRLVYWPILAVVVASAVLGAVNLLRPHWTRGRLIARIAIRGCEMITSAAFLLVAAPVVVQVAGATAAQQATLTLAANWVVRVTVAAVGLFALGDAIRGAWLLARGRYRTAPFNGAEVRPAAGTGAI